MSIVLLFYPNFKYNIVGCQAKIEMSYPYQNRNVLCSDVLCSLLVSVSFRGPYRKCPPGMILRRGRTFPCFCRDCFLYWLRFFCYLMKPYPSILMEFCPYQTGHPSNLPNSFNLFGPWRKMIFFQCPYFLTILTGSFEHIFATSLRSLTCHIINVDLLILINQHCRSNRIIAFRIFVVFCRMPLGYSFPRTPLCSIYRLSIHSICKLVVPPQTTRVALRAVLSRRTGSPNGARLRNSGKAFRRLGKNFKAFSYTVAVPLKTLIQSTWFMTIKSSNVNIESEHSSQLCCAECLFWTS